MAKNDASVTVSEHRISIDSDIGTENDTLRHRSAEDDYQDTTMPQSQANSIDPRVRWMTMLILTLLVVVVDFAANGISAPLVGVYEDKLCAELRSQSDHALNVDICDRNPMIEREVSLIRGTSQLLESLPAILLSTFYGSLADRRSRRLVLSLSLLGLTLNYTWVTLIAGLAPKVSLRLVWVGPFFMVIGGGTAVTIAMIFACVADLATPENRMSTFAVIQATAFLSALAGSFASSLLMERIGNYVPLVMSVALVGVGSLPAIFLPDTRPSVVSDSHADQEPDTIPLLPKPTEATAKFGRQLSFLDSVTIALQNVWIIPGAIPILVAGFCFYLGDPFAILTFQYMPYRFGISLAKANMFNVLNMSVSTFVLLTFIPLASTLLVRWGMTSFRKDMLLLYISGLLCLTGAIILAIASNLATSILGLVVLSSGVGTAPLVRSILLDIFPSDEAAFAISLISVAKALAESFRGPLWSALYALSLRWNNILMGLPFFGGALVYAGAICSLFLIRSPTRFRGRATD